MAELDVRLLNSPSGGAGAAPAAFSRKKLVPSVVINEQPSEMLCCRFSPDATLVAAGCADGKIRVYKTETGRLLYTLNHDNRYGELPVTSLRFRPEAAGAPVGGSGGSDDDASDGGDDDGTSIRNMLLSGNSDGYVMHWHVSSQLGYNPIQEEDNQVFALDYRGDGLQFVTGGSDFAVRLYDEEGYGLITELTGHTSRVFSAKFHPDDPTLILSGGWDNTLMLWDTRLGMSAMSIYGPHICGDSVDVVGNTILTGSHREEEMMQLWDFTTGNLIETVEWGETGNGEPCKLYTAQFSGHGPEGAAYMAAGGSGANEVKVFETESKAEVGRLDSLENGVYSLDWASSGEALAVAGGDAELIILELVEMGTRRRGRRHGDDAGGS